MKSSIKNLAFWAICIYTFTVYGNENMYDKIINTLLEDPITKSLLSDDLTHCYSQYVIGKTSNIDTFLAQFNTQI